MAQQIRALSYKLDNLSLIQGLTGRGRESITTIPYVCCGAHTHTINTKKNLKSSQSDGLQAEHGQVYVFPASRKI